MIKKWISLFLIWLPLTGCIPAAIVIGASVGGSVLYDKRTFKTMSSDHKATAKASRLIREKQDLRGMGRVKVSVFNRVALLVGEVRNASVKSEIGQIVAHVSGVNRLYNELRIEGTPSSLSRFNDSWLASKVRTQMLLKSGLRSSNIKIVTENGVVYLMGTLSRSQATLAAQVASQVSGTKRVVKVFELEV